MFAPMINIDNDMRDRPLAGSDFTEFLELIVSLAPELGTPGPRFRPPLHHKDTAKRQEIPLVGGFGCLELCLYGIRELA